MDPGTWQDNPIRTRNNWIHYVRREDKCVGTWVGPVGLQMRANQKYSKLARSFLLNRMIGVERINVGNRTYQVCNGHIYHEKLHIVPLNTSPENYKCKIGNLRLYSFYIFITVLKKITHVNKKGQMII